MLQLWAESVRRADPYRGSRLAWQPQMTWPRRPHSRLSTIGDCVEKVDALRRGGAVTYRSCYLAIAMAGVGYFVRSVTVIWNRFDRTAKAS